MKDSDLSKFKIQNGVLALIEANASEKEKEWFGIEIAEEPQTPYEKSNASGTESNPGIPKAIHSTINGELPSYNNPVIPAGFSPVNTDEALWTNISTDWNKGLVIQDSNGNQFVWVPVDGTNVRYEKWCTTNISYSSTSDDTLPSGFSVSNITDTYKGFYISRYEASFDYNDGNARIASKKSIAKDVLEWLMSDENTGHVWNFVNYIDAKSYSESMAQAYGYNVELIGTNLITGAQWDTVMKWIQNSEISVTDSRTWGNYTDSRSPANVSEYGSLQTSGHSDTWRAKNIYDLAGNLYEWTSEKYSTDSIFRGGSYDDSGATNPAAYRYNFNSSSAYNDFGFRSALYIK